MKLKYYTLFACLLFSLPIVSAQQSAIPVLLKTALKEAVAENKNVIVIFHASWCVWCHKMDSSMNDITCIKMFRSNYVTCHLDVDESAGKKNLETPGAIAFRKQYHGEKEGLPFWLVLDKNGKLLADSRMPATGKTSGGQGTNTGCPSSEEEVTYLISVLKKTSKLTEDELKVIAARFSKNN